MSQFLAAVLCLAGIVLAVFSGSSCDAGRQLSFRGFQIPPSGEWPVLVAPSSIAPSSEAVDPGSRFRGDICREGMETVQEERIAGVKVTLMWGACTRAGDMLVLPGWNHSPMRWCRETRLCRQALSAGYRLVLPEMGKSVYQSEVFSETRTEWKNTPGLPWVMQSLIPELQRRYGILAGKDNFLVGLSTGARGVVRIAVATGRLFRAGAALSGDYDPARMPDDRLMTGFYGPYARFSRRWEMVDNPMREIGELQIPMYLGHGLKDRVVLAAQTEAFFARLPPAVRAASRLHIANAGHDYAYWDSEVDAILAFFRGIREK